jgi:hypothetical protein
MEFFDQMREMERLTQPFRDMERLTQPFRDMERLTQPFREMEQLREMEREMERLTQPFREMEQLREMEREMERLAQPLSEVQRRAELEMERLAEPIRQAEREMERLAEPIRQAEQLAQREMERLAEPIRQAEQLAQPTVDYVHLLLPDYDSFNAEVLALQGMGVSDLDFPNRDLLNYFLGQAAQVTSLQQREADQSIAMLSALSLSSPAGTLTWRSKQPDALHPGVWSSSQSPRSSRQSRKVEVHCDVDCAICGNTILVSATEVSLSSEEEINVKLSIFPLCTECTRAAAGSSEYWEEALEEVFGTGGRPQLFLIQGDGQGSDPPRGRKTLSLVRNEKLENPR